MQELKDGRKMEDLIWKSSEYSSFTHRSHSTTTTTTTSLPHPIKPTTSSSTYSPPPLPIPNPLLSPHHITLIHIFPSSSPSLLFSHPIAFRSHTQCSKCPKHHASRASQSSQVESKENETSPQITFQKTSLKLSRKIADHKQATNTGNG
ncbi:hypothetical protein IQ07DRAFT_12052 [Pyrenochaeta sp. DS3sAY3a]|nr:hypothetical protein IQ07DRAFT_12052 [Pyrenochaeta sp. DS3sAY3a]